LPELPEVETIRNALAPVLLGNQITQIYTYVPKLRTDLNLEGRAELLNNSIMDITRRSKYLLLHFENKTILILHLGMTGSFRLETTAEPRRKHDHIEFILTSGMILRYNDPRRFGQAVINEADNKIDLHPLLKKLGPEPLSKRFSKNYILKKVYSRSVSIKKFIMDSNNVVGVGNIYASEALYRAGIHPELVSRELSETQAKKLVKSIKDVLKDAINAGGTTIRDYASLNGEEGYFNRSLDVYGREQELCNRCKTTRILKIVLAGRSSYYCPKCQKK
jgi:formamidopyrimidine-DNA glycosylase